MNDTLPNVAEFFNVATHNGKITIQNRATGQHRTFRIKTQKADARFAPGERIVSLLTGSDNNRDYTQFGFVKADGTIALWNKFRTPTFEHYARMLRHREAFEKATTQTAPEGYEYLFEGTCRRCNACLTNPESIKTGIGPVCAKGGSARD